MRLRKLRHLMVAGSIGAITTLLVPATPASAATVGTSPHWFTGKVNLARFGGSETTYYVMNRLTTLFNQTAMFGCVLQAADLRTCDTNADNAATDTLDNYDRNEITQGLPIGSSNGIAQMCGTKPTGGLTVDASRSSRPFRTGDCSDTVFKQLAKEALVGVAWPNEPVPAGATRGNVAAGWRPGDSANGPYTGKAFSLWGDISNVGSPSLAKRLWCQTDASRISDWGQLTDPTKPVGDGTPIGVPITIYKVNPGSGTISSWNTFTGCSDSNTNGSTTHPVVQENNGPQIRDIAQTALPTDPVGQFNLISSSLYYMSYASYFSTPYTRGGGTATKINGQSVTGAKIAAGTIATTRTVYNVYRTSTLRASVAGFLNWIHADDSGKTQHGLNLLTGKNYFDEINNAITTQFGFVRVFDPLIPSGDIADLTT